MESNEPNKASTSNSTNSHGAISKTKNDVAPNLSTTRLTSFRVPRDLTLGGNIKTEKVKKVYTPNLNVQRKKKGEGDAPVIKTEKEREDRHKNAKDYLKAKKQNNLIQSAGVFSERITDSRKRFSRGGGYSRESSSDRSDAGTSALEKPKLNSIPTINKEEEDERLRLLLRDDFIDDNKEILLENAPIVLPLNNPKNIYADNYAELFNKTEYKADCKKDVDIKPIIENGKVKLSPTKSKIKHEENLFNMLETQPSSKYIFMQFPTCLPFLRSEDDSTSNFQSKKQTTVPTSENKSKSSESVLNDIKEGCIGKLQILRSGKTRLLLSGHKFNVEMGTSTSFRQDLMAIQINEEEKNGEVIHLGPVNHTLIVSVDLESLLNET